MNNVIYARGHGARAELLPRARVHAVDWWSMHNIQTPQHNAYLS